VLSPPQTFPGIKSSLSETPQPLILTGTVVGHTPHEGLALIGTSAQNPQTYTAGALLVNGARVSEIFADHVVLAKDGRSISLYIQNRKGYAPNASQENDLLAVVAPIRLKPAIATSSEPFTDLIRPSPVYEGSTLLGYKVFAGRRADLFAHLGLRPGDVITSFDGSPLIDPNEAMEAFRRLANGMSMSADVKRDGQVLKLSLDGSLLTPGEKNDRDDEAADLAAAGSAN
jgi:type II secretion system protein C